MSQQRVSSEKELIQNCLQFLTFSESADPEDVAYYRSKLRNIKRFVVVDLGSGHYIFAPGAYVSYRNLERRDDWLARTLQASRHESRSFLDRNYGECRVEKGHQRYPQLVQAYYQHCATWGVQPSKETLRGRSFWLIAAEADDTVIAEELTDAQSYEEGAVRRIQVNAYERDAAARKACIAHYGNRYICEVCGFDFVAVYGTRGKEFIHVHHMTALHTIGKAYQVNPVRDLIPVCCNCHAMIHRYREDMLSPEALKKLIKKRRER